MKHPPWLALVVSIPAVLPLPGAGPPQGQAAGPSVFTRRASVSSSGGEGNESSRLSSLSGDGRLLAFESLADNLVPGDTNGVQDVFLHDLRTARTARVSISSSGREGDGRSGSPSLSATGRFVAFYSEAANLVPGDTNGAADVFVRDLLLGLTTRVSVDSLGAEGDGSSWSPAVGADGRYVAFESWAGNLVPGDTNGMPDVFLHDLQYGLTERISVSSAGLEGDGGSYGPTISADGRLVAFYSMASNLVPGDTNGELDVFVRDRLAGWTVRVSVDSSGRQGNSHCGRAAISADGRFVAFQSYSSNLVPGDTNGTWDVFVHELGTGVTTRVSVSSSGAEGDGASWWPVISADGGLVGFQSEAANLVGGDSNRLLDVFVRDRGPAVTTRVSVDSWGFQADGPCYWPSLSAEGRLVSFASRGGNLVRGDTNGRMDVFVHGSFLVPR